MEKLTPMEALTVLFIIKIGRSNGRQAVEVAELARAMKRSESRIRLILNSLKSKGIVTDLSEAPLADESHLGPESTEDIYKMIHMPSRGVKKKWRLIGVDILKDEEVVKFLTNRLEFDAYFSLDKVLKFLGIEHDRT